MQQNWFQSWFNSPYYFILYKHRNNQEAELFIDNLTAFLKPAQNSKMLDIACGKGRHAIYLHNKGFDVTGIDLSENSIDYAKQFEDDRLHFYVHDMRKLLYINYFDIALNLFTSFGYFKTTIDNLNALKAFSKSIKPEGKLVIDYFNTHKVLENLIPNETKTIENIAFEISKKHENGKIIKSIAFSDQGKMYNFNEIVQTFKLAEFESLIEEAGLKLEHTFGDYHLNPFDEKNSDRLILICSKK